MSENSNVQNDSIEKFIADKKPVHLFLKGGIKLGGVLVGADTHSVLLEKGGLVQMVYKSAVSTIVQSSPD
jgi:host factor-I protein